MKRGAWEDFDRAQDDAAASELRGTLQRYDAAVESGDASETDRLGTEVVEAACRAWRRAEHEIWRREALRTIEASQGR